jgi:hypothetical protein
VGSNPLEAMCIFLILARRRLYGGMVMGMGMGCARRRESEWQNTEWAERGMADYYYSINK